MSGLIHLTRDGRAFFLRSSLVRAVEERSDPPGVTVHIKDAGCDAQSFTVDQSPAEVADLIEAAEAT